MILLKESLTAKLMIEKYMEEIGKRYMYEGYNTYTMEELNK